MIKVNISDGSTLTFNLDDDDDLKQWVEWSAVKEFQNKIRGIGIYLNKKFYTLPLPKKFQKNRFYAQKVFTERDNKKIKVAERVICHSDEIRVTLLVYCFLKPPPPINCKIEVEKIGKNVFDGVNFLKKGLTNGNIGE